jgi:predicted alpha/beta superfamily hydrolase
MQDGQNIVDPATSAFQVDWQLDEAADTLITKGLIEPIIIVGIYNTPDRDLEYSEDSLGIAYMNFIIDSLKPFIDKNYRTLTAPENTASGGGSLGALTAFLLPWKYPNYFSKALCFSPAFKVQQYDVVNNVIEDEDQKRKIKIYINNGDGELDTQLQSGVDEMLDALKSKNYVEDKDFYYVKAKNTFHGERDWSKNIWRALIFLFGTEKGRELL